MFVKTLELPDDSELRTFLRNKLKEYTVRVNVSQNIDAAHKYFVTDELLKYKILDTDNLREKAKAFISIGFNEDLFKNAVGVVYNYCYAPHRNRHADEN